MKLAYFGCFGLTCLLGWCIDNRVGMHSVEEIESVFKRHGWVMRRGELAQVGVHACTLARLMDEGLILKPRTGYYLWAAEDGPDELALLLRIAPEGIIAMDSALSVYGYTDRVPNRWHLALPQNANRSKYRHGYPPIQPYFLTPESLKLGATHARYQGHRIRVYDRERTICDCIFRRNRMDLEVFVKAVRAYGEDPKRNIARLSDYAGKLGIRQPTMDIVGLWQ